MADQLVELFRCRRGVVGQLSLVVRRSGQIPNNCFGSINDGLANAGMNLQFPKLALVVLVGPSGSGKSTFARKHFLPTEVISSDFCRGLVSDDENAQSATNDAFDVLNY